MRDQVEEQFLQADAGTGAAVGCPPAGDAVPQGLAYRRRAVVVQPEMQLHLGAVVAEEAKLLEGVTIAYGLGRRQPLGYGRLQSEPGPPQSRRRCTQILLVHEKVQIARGAHYIVGVERLECRTLDEHVFHRNRVERVSAVRQRRIESGLHVPPLVDDPVPREGPFHCLAQQPATYRVEFGATHKPQQAVFRRQATCRLDDGLLSFL